MLRGRAVQIAMLLLLVPAVTLLIFQMTSYLQRNTEGQQAEMRLKLMPPRFAPLHKATVPLTAESAWTAASAHACKTTFTDEPRRAVLVTNIQHSATYNLVMMLRKAGRSVIAVNDAVTETCDRPAV
jgi:hypothetical protein